MTQRPLLGKTGVPILSPTGVRLGRFPLADLFAAPFSFSSPSSKVGGWNGSSWKAPIGGGPYTGGVTEVKVLRTIGDYLYAGGRFASIDPGTGSLFTVNGIARYDGFNWFALGDGRGVGLTCNDIIEHAGQIVACGDRVANAAAGTFYLVGRWDESTWTSMGAGLIDNVYPGPVCHKLLMYDDQLIAIGHQIFQKSEPPQSILAAVIVHNGTSWDAVGGFSGINQGSTFTPGPTCGAVWDDKLIVGAGGNISVGGSSIGQRVAAWNRTSWSALGSGINGAVSAMHVHQGKLYVAGAFTQAGGVTANRIAVYEGSNWQPVGSGFNNTVNCLASYKGKLVAAGNFTASGATLINKLAFWNPDDSTWTGTAGTLQNITAVAQYP